LIVKQAQQTSRDRRNRGSRSSAISYGTPSIAKASSTTPTARRIIGEPRCAWRNGEERRRASPGTFKGGTIFFVGVAIEQAQYLELESSQPPRSRSIRVAKSPASVMRLDEVVGAHRRLEGPELHLPVLLGAYQSHHGGHL
jgi:hypothetical protein